MAFRRYNYTNSFEICSSCFTNRYNYLSQWILFSYAHAVHISLLQEIQLFIHSSSYVSCAAHQIHISLPANPLLDSGTGNPLLVIPLSDLCVNADLIEIILPGFRIGPKVNFALYLPKVKMCSIRQQQVYS